MSLLCFVQWNRTKATSIMVFCRFCSIVLRKHIYLREQKISFTYHICICGCDDVIKTLPTLLGLPLLPVKIHSHIAPIATHPTLSPFLIAYWTFTTLIKLSKNLNLQPFVPLHCYSLNLLSWPLIILPLHEILQPIFSLLCFLPFSESWLCLYLVV